MLQEEHCSTVMVESETAVGVAIGGNSIAKTER